MLSVLLFLAIGCGGETATDVSEKICDCYTAAKEREGADRSRAWAKCEETKVLKEASWEKRGKKQELVDALASCAAFDDE